LATAVKRARFLALIPYCDNHWHAIAAVRGSDRVDLIRTAPWAAAQSRR